MALRTLSDSSTMELYPLTRAQPLASCQCCSLCLWLLFPYAFRTESHHTWNLASSPRRLKTPDRSHRCPSPPYSQASLGFSPFSLIPTRIPPSPTCLVQKRRMLAAEVLSSLSPSGSWSHLPSGSWSHLPQFSGGGGGALLLCVLTGS